MRRFLGIGAFILKLAIRVTGKVTGASLAPLADDLFEIPANSRKP